MKPRRPVVLKNPGHDKSIEVLWNLPVKLDVLTDFTLCGGSLERVADDILDAATHLACAKGTWYGQPSEEPILDELRDSFRLVSSLTFENPFVARGEYSASEIHRSASRSATAQVCVAALVDYAAKLSVTQ